jgi:hypothetical protein
LEQRNSLQIDLLKKPRIAYFLSHPIQYFSPLFRELAIDTDLRVYYFSDASIRGGQDKGFGRDIQWDTALLEGYTYKFLKNVSNRPSLMFSIQELSGPCGKIRIQ